MKLPQYPEFALFLTFSTYLYIFLLLWSLLRVYQTKPPSISFDSLLRCSRDVVHRRQFFFSNQKSQSRHLINLVAPTASEPWADITKCLRMKKKLKLKGFCHLSSTSRIYVYTTDTLVFTDAVSGPIWSMMKKIRLNSMQRLQQ